MRAVTTLDASPSFTSRTRSSPGSPYPRQRPSSSRSSVPRSSGARTTDALVILPTLHLRNLTTRVYRRPHTPPTIALASPPSHVSLVAHEMTARGGKTPRRRWARGSGLAVTCAAGNSAEQV